MSIQTATQSNGSPGLEVEVANEIEESVNQKPATPSTRSDRIDATVSHTPSAPRDDLDSIHYIPELDAYFSPGRTFSIRYLMIHY